MKAFSTAVISVALATASVLPRAQPESSGRYVLREDLASAKAIKDVIVRSTAVPLLKRYGDMTPQEKDVIRGFYTSMGPADEPPFPDVGLEPLVKALHRAQSKLLVTGDLYLVAEVDPNGEAQSVTVYGSPSPEMTKFAASALLLQKFKPALCAGTPCAQNFPFSLRFVLH